MTGSARRLVLGLMLALAAPVMAVGAAAPVIKRLPSDEILAVGLRSSLAEQPAPMSDDELDGYRGGYTLSPDLNFQFGAVVKTFEDGQLALQTTVNLTQSGVNIHQTAGAGVTPGSTLGPIDLAGATGGTFTTPGGTTLIQNVANGQLANIILNTASNRSFRQETAVTVVLPGFADVQSDMLRTLTGMRLNMDTAAATVRSVSH